MNAEKYVNMAFIVVKRLIFLISASIGRKLWETQVRVRTGRKSDYPGIAGEFGMTIVFIMLIGEALVGQEASFSIRKGTTILSLAKAMDESGRSRTLSQVIISIEAKNRYPKLYQVLGPNDEFYGYMYGSRVGRNVMFSPRKL